MKYRAECQKDFCEKGLREGYVYVVNSLDFVQNERDVYICWADEQITSLRQNQSSNDTTVYKGCEGCNQIPTVECLQKRLITGNC